MPCRQFLTIAREVAAGQTEFHWRAASIHAYYALFLECRNALVDWGLCTPRRGSVHAWVRLKYTYASDADLRRIGDTLDDLVRLRNHASYDLNGHADFASAARVLSAIHEVEDALALLDGIHDDPARRSSAVALLKS